MAGNVKDLRISTIQALTKVLVNGTQGQYPCVMAANGMDESEAATDQCKRLIEEIDKIKADHKAELKELRTEHEKKIAFLKDQVEFKEEPMPAKDELLVTIIHLIDIERK